MPPDQWDQGAAYEIFMGRWSRRIAPEFLAWLGVPAGSTWLDVGCGTGALSQAILAHSDPRAVVGCDRSAEYVAIAARGARDERARFLTADLSALPRRGDGFDAVVSGLVLNFLPDAAAALSAMIARARSGATLAAYVWDYSEGMEMLRVFWDVAAELDPAAREQDEGTRFPLCRSGALRSLWVAGGLREVSDGAIEAATVFENFDDYWTPFQSGQGPAPGYVRQLAPTDRERLRDALRGKLPAARNGSISLRARAWAVRGTVT